MNTYVTGTIIKELRERGHLTQTELADQLMVSNKTISKWETGKGLPDITLLEPLAKALNVSLIELVSGSTVQNQNKSANLKRGKWYVCPVCGNVIRSTGDAVISCCGVTIPSLELEEECEDHELQIGRVENEYELRMEHPMTKEHYISFVAYVTEDRMQLHKLYPEQEVDVRFQICGHGMMYAYCNHHGLFGKRI